ncbi:hypothetical protein ACNKHX_00565 [Shigella flexneri]
MNARIRCAITLREEERIVGQRCPMGIDAEVTMIKPIAARPKVSHSKGAIADDQVVGTFFPRADHPAFSAVDIQTGHSTLQARHLQARETKPST